MDVRSICNAMMRGLAVFAAVLVFGLAPAFDAVACAAETPVAAADHDVSVHAPEDVAEHGPNEAACLHGHCHHGQVPIAAPQDLHGALYAKSGAPTPLAAERRDGLHLSGLKRPPRA